MAETQDLTIAVALEGGPADLPVASRSVRIDGAQEKIKVEHLGGYEHFERTEDWHAGDEERRVVYRWTLRTRIAE
ncbi:DUF5988 family protein [Actinoplanes sp. GCM10030250]|uniref:DUF5988 family protein n=1 Tax=Actinoplanes sp. GCM10030250 TaxID=3273376 RepID=UPI003605BA0F